MKTYAELKDTNMNIFDECIETLMERMNDGLSFFDLAQTEEEIAVLLEFCSANTCEENWEEELSEYYEDELCSLFINYLDDYLDFVTFVEEYECCNAKYEDYYAYYQKVSFIESEEEIEEMYYDEGEWCEYDEFRKYIDLVFAILRYIVIDKREEN